MTNILQAIATIINHPIPDLLSYYKSQSNNRINALGDALEYFVKDAFANTIDEPELSNKLEKYTELFSWSGNPNNPPDLIIRNGDAIEVKKIQTSSLQIPLNSSYPKSKLFSNNPQIASACRKCETWTEKDIVYAIGATSADKTKQTLKRLWLIYGDCYAASKEYYERIRDQIATGINAIPDVEFSKTRELGRVNKVDPLGITYLRIRGMWGINNPAIVFDYINTGYDPQTNFQIIAIMKESKYLSFPLDSRTMIESISVPGFNINTQRIKCPDNPVNLIPAKIITYKI
ncbi:NgoPII family restriction endonuclease [Microcoleus vaginatus]|uniref:NgoPII family restriction endonuclease n=1 Tax=Microcoleus vaginatus TaxID=119532 RepID=UPI001F6091BD|nr:NgoPII family restriction endonuclease [Microcoleus vaginatus HSN003]